MSRILITSGPTREYLDPVRYLTNASTGKMGAALACAALQAGFEVTIVSGPVGTAYPAEAEVLSVVSTAEMLEQAKSVFPGCRGVIGVAAPCDFTPVHRSDVKLGKEERRSESGCAEFQLELTETPDIMAALGQMKKPGQWSVAFALETDHHRERAMAKLIKKRADFIALNRPAAIGAAETAIEFFGETGLLAEWRGSKKTVAEEMIAFLVRRGV